jgi:hypothetical protein
VERFGETSRLGGDVVGKAGQTGWVDDVEATSVLRAAVGVNRDHSIGAGPIAGGGALGDTRPPPFVVAAGEEHRCTGPFESLHHDPGDAPVELGLGVSVHGRRPGGVARLGPVANVDQTPDLVGMRPVPPIVTRVDDHGDPRQHR